MIELEMHDSSKEQYPATIVAGLPMLLRCGEAAQRMDGLLAVPEKLTFNAMGKDVCSAMEALLGAHKEAARRLELWRVA
eukprot:3740706-Lingulodinium_polyedra.AAC.1